MSRNLISILGGVGIVLVVLAVGLLPRLEFLVGEEPAETHAGGLSVEIDADTPIGGPFTLVNGAGETVTDSSFPGQYLLVYFGYTYCPDVCPTSLQTMADALNALDPAIVERIQPLFVTVDPERDRPADVAEYAGFFHPKLMGLTGTVEQVTAAARAYKVYFAKVEQPDSAAPYLLDHSAITYLMAPDGTLAAFFRHGEPAADMAARLREIVGEGGS
ncbi:SCO family protein [Rhodospira trueperi]|uniref:Protein SCO1/2 n=1 Tax=Rhodospira trueperi TaxID=69960 RepID=A0A1G7BTL0_9PROT|nr:SCO family protein [Rhodospira trueperi]SDE30399.1 protein SCO1/2 [Rhodospira trueperi]